MRIVDRTAATVNDIQFELRLSLLAFRTLEGFWAGVLPSGARRLVILGVLVIFFELIRVGDRWQCKER